MSKRQLTSESERRFMVDAGILEDLDAVDEAARQIVPTVVMRHREAGVLTWALMHRIEAEVLDELDATGVHSDTALSMLRSSRLMPYPRDDRPASFGNASAVPIIFRQIEEVWRRVH